MIQLLEALLTKYNKFTNLSTVLMFAIMLGSNYSMMEQIESLENNSYNYEYEIISYAFADLNSTTEAVNLVHEWEEKGWGSQIAAVKILCTTLGRSKLENLIGVGPTVDVCRVSL